MIYYLVLAALIPYSSSAEDKDLVPTEIRPLIEFMSVSSGDARYVSMARTKDTVECVDDYKTLNSHFTIPFKKNDSKWKFTVMNSLTGPKDAFNKEYVAGDYKLSSELYSLIKTNFNSHDERMKAVSTMCQGKSEKQKIQLAAHLGGNLSEIYDYDRKSGVKVTSEDQWNALYNRASGNPSATAGVCRDATLTVSQFLVACGFSKKQVSIQSYTTPGSGHQVVSVRDSKGQLYNINWSELYATDEKSGAAPNINPSNLFVGLDFHTFDADGKIVGFRKTELGDIIKAVSGGSIDDPNYLPHVLRLEANFGALTGNLFTTETSAGEKASGVALAYKNLYHNDTVYVSMGSAFVKNAKEVRANEITNLELEQNIVYFQLEAGYRPEFQVFKKGNHLVRVRPGAMISTEAFWMNSKVSYNQENYSQVDVNVTNRVGTEVIYDRGPLSTWAGISSDLGWMRSGNNEVTGSNPTIFVNNVKVNVGGAIERPHYVMTMEAGATHSHYENNYSVATSVLAKNAQASGTILYRVFDRGQGNREDYVMVKGEKNFSLERVGKVAVGVAVQYPLEDGRDATYMGTVQFKGK